MRTKQAIKHFGSAAALAKALGITRQSVHDWGDEVPEGRAYQLEVMTDGELIAPRPKQQPERRAS
jgi:DNA-binding transcriptional regulator YdaS (Cro superfamily)